MLDYSILKPEGILVLTPNAPLSEADFSGVTAAVDTYLLDHDKLRGVMIHAHQFPGWEGFGAFAAHLHFVRAHHEKVERIALVTDSHFAAIAESFSKHFTSAVIKQFPFGDDARALSWLEDPDAHAVG